MTTPIVFYGNVPVEVCQRCYDAHEAGKPWEYAILDLDTFATMTHTDERHIVMDDGRDLPLCIVVKMREVVQELGEA